MSSHIDAKYITKFYKTKVDTQLRSILVFTTNYKNLLGNRSQSLMRHSECLVISFNIKISNVKVY